MIFVTVGSQMPFDRLVEAMDLWAARHPEQEVRAQVGRTDFKPRHLVASEAMSPAAFQQQVAAADVVVAHAGMGSVLTAIEHGKPLILMPRRGDLRETRNDHQLATARWLASKPGIQIAHSGEELDAALQRALDGGAAPGLASSAPLQSLQGFLADVLRDAAQRR